MYNLTNINELEQFIGNLEPTQWFIIDVPDPASPTGFTSYKVSPTAINPNTSFIGLTDTPANYIGQSGKVPAVNSLEDGLEFVDPKLYDSGWVNAPVFNGSYGFANTGNVAYRPKIRVVGNVLYMEGLYLFPMPTTAGGTILDTNGAGYTLQGKTFSDLYTNSVGNGFSIDNKNQAFTSFPILPFELRPTETVRGIRSNGYMTKTKNITGGRMRLTSYVAQLGFLTDGRLFATSIEAEERNGDTGTGWNRNLIARTNVDKFNTNDKLMNYDTFRNAFDSLGLDTLRVPNVEGYTLEYNFDGSRSNDFGGFFTPFKTSYVLNPALSQAQIKTAIDSL